MNQLVQLNLPVYDFKIQSNTIFDPIRKKWVVLTPEEWVRQNFLSYLIFEKKYPKSLIRAEETIQSFNKIKRCDAVVYSSEIKPLLIVECKAPKVKISDKTFGQIAVYNAALKAPFLIVTNGFDHYCCRIHFNDNSFSFLSEIPEYEQLRQIK